MIGRLLSDRYEIRTQLGEGGTATVFEALDTVLGRLVAVKILRSEFSHDEKFVQRFRREASASAQLSHPNIVQVFDVGRDGDIDYIVMEYVDGCTLAEKIRSRGKLDIAEAVELAAQVLVALDHAHRQGVIHRDIKPQNILITRDGQVKVTDFGIARAVGSATLAGTQAIMGSAHYISPEQARGNHTGVESDLYSLGVVLFEMLTGCRPFDGETAVTVALKHLQEAVPDPSDFNPEIPETLRLILRKAMSKESHRRYTTAQQFLEDLSRYDWAEPHELIAGQPDLEDTLVLPPLSGGSTNGGTPSFRPGEQHERPWRARRKIRSWRWWAMLAVLALVIFGGAASAAYYVSGWLNPPTVEVPPLVGMDFDEAVAGAESLDIELRVIQERHEDEHPKGVIVWQNPAAGQKVKPGGLVDVIVSLGPEQVPGGMPDVEGQELRTAEIQLNQAGLEVTVEYEHHDEVPRDYVIRQDPPPGTSLVVGSAVTLVVSSGPQPGAVELPNFVGRPLAAVRDELAQLGLQLGQLDSQVSDYPQQYIHAQDPSPGARVQPGTKVNLVVSQGNGTEPEVATLSITLPTEPQNQAVEVRVRDQSERIVHTGQHRGGSRLQVQVHWYRPAAEVMVYINGQLNTRTSLPQAGTQLDAGQGDDQDDMDDDMDPEEGDDQDTPDA